MARHGYVRLSRDAAALQDALEHAATAAGLSPVYPEDAQAEADIAVSTYRLPETDLSEVPFVTIDPEGSTDLDQALWIEDLPGGGWLVRYAIADVPGFVALGGALDAETRRRGETAYLPQGRFPLHPTQISEDAGSLLPGRARGAYVWDIEVAPSGEGRLRALTHATVNSREQLSYPQAQERLEASDPLMTRLHALGAARRADESRRGGANLDLPEHEVEPDPAGGYRLQTRAALVIEEDNAQVSLLTGMCAADVMLRAGVGLLRTMPAPDETSLGRFRAVTAGLGHPWTDPTPYGEYLRGLDVADPKQLAIMHAAGSLFRGAAYTPFDGEAPAISEQAAVGAPYAHTTAPLRRLVDRFVLVLCHASVNGLVVPAGVREALPLLPEAMKASGAGVSAAERACLDVVEASLLTAHVGATLQAIVLDGPLPDAGGGAGAHGGSQPGQSPAAVSQTAQSQPARADAAPANRATAGAAPAGSAPTNGSRKGTGSVKVQLLDPPVEARAAGTAPAGTQVGVEVLSVDVATGAVSLRLATAQVPATA